jgi:bifunctional DNA-binding transcriptional regulator/antitoxin component of YhaV-PrlF toxin-antitoxin module
MFNQHITVGEGGRMVIPAVYRKEFDIKLIR